MLNESRICSTPQTQRPTTRPTGRAASRRNSTYVVINLGMKRKERTMYVVGRTTSTSNAQRPTPTAARITSIHGIHLLFECTLHKRRFSTTRKQRTFPHGRTAVHYVSKALRKTSLRTHLAE